MNSIASMQHIDRISCRAQYQLLVEVELTFFPTLTIGTQYSESAGFGIRDSGFQNAWFPSYYWNWKLEVKVQNRESQVLIFFTALSVLHLI
jgi:hypothetical protein